MNILIEHLIKQVSPRYFISGIIGIVLFIGYQQYEVNSQQQELINRHSEKIQRIEQGLVIQQEIKRSVEDMKVDQRAQTKSIDRKLEMILQELIKDSRDRPEGP